MGCLFVLQPQMSFLMMQDCFSQPKTLWLLSNIAQRSVLCLSSTMMKICTLHCHRTRSNVTDVSQFQELIWCTFDRSDMFTQEYSSSGKFPRSPSNYGPGVLSYFNDHCCIPLVPQGALLPSMVSVFLDNLGTDVLKQRYQSINPKSLGRTERKSRAINRETERKTL